MVEQVTKLGYKPVFISQDLHINLYYNDNTLYGPFSLVTMVNYFTLLSTMALENNDVDMSIYYLDWITNLRKLNYVQIV